MELLCQLCPSPISTRGYDTYPETVKVSRDGKDDRDGQTHGRRTHEKGFDDPRLAPGQARREAKRGKEGRSQEKNRENQPGRGAEGRCTEEQGGYTEEQGEQGG
jgi:hypothetical protein